MANHRHERLINEFNEAVCNLNYLEAMKVVGAMNYASVDHSREYEARLLYLMKDYKRVVALLSDCDDCTQLEKDLYITSLTLLERFADVNQLFDQNTTTDPFCRALIRNHFYDSQVELTVTKAYATSTDDFFKKQFFRFLSLKLVSIYEELQHAQILKEAGVDVTDIIETNINRVKKLGLEDPYLDIIADQIRKEGNFEFNYAIALEYIYIGGVNKEKGFFKVYDKIDDIIFHLDLKRRYDPESICVDATVEYGSKLVEYAEARFPIVGDFLKELICVSSLYPGPPFNDKGTTLFDFWKDILERYYPELLDEAERDIRNNHVYTILSDKGKFAFKAATWQYQHTINDNYGIRDAGMLCLSYMRIIELELNVTILSELQKHYKEINKIYIEQSEKLSGKQKNNFKNKWRIHVAELSKDKPGHTLERLWYLFVNLSDNRNAKKNGDADESIHNDDLVSQEMKKGLKQILNVKGMNALKSGRYADLIAHEIRNKFRNPPAHTVYVNKETAFECKQYVEKTLEELYSYRNL